jgi:hypothetical protein
MKKMLLLLLTPVLLPAQDNQYTFQDDVILLEAFTVGTPKSRGFDPRHRGGSPSTSPIRLIKKADMVTVNLTISSDNKKPEERIKALQDALHALKDAGAKRRDILVKTGYVELPLVSSNRYFFSSAKSGEEISSFDVVLIAKMLESDSVFARTAYLNSFIDEIQFGKGITGPVQERSAEADRRGTSFDPGDIWDELRGRFQGPRSTRPSPAVERDEFGAQPPLPDDLADKELIACVCPPFARWT